MARILVVDDDRLIADSLSTIFQIAGYDCQVAYCAEEALALLRSFIPDLVLTDVVMPRISGVQLASELRLSHPEIPVILLSGNAATEDLLFRAGDKVGPVTVLAKPCPPRDLLQIVASSLARRLSAAS